MLEYFVTAIKISPVTHSFRETMKDLKFKEKLSGLGVVDSIICESRKEDWKTIDKIPQRVFPSLTLLKELNRSILTTHTRRRW